MLNSPVLDTAIGLVFIFLLYSLLATSINESIAALFGMRARMLKKGIVSGMLSNTKHKQWLWIDTLKGIGDVILEPLKLIAGYKPIPKGSLGDKIYEHPIIKNYGSNDRYKTPSYISKENFSTVLIEVLGDYWENYEVAAVSHAQGNGPTINSSELPTITKITYLVDYLLSPQGAALRTPQSGCNCPDFLIDEDTLKILQLHLKKSYLNLDEFTKQIEGWYDDTMNRVSGWYKRQVQMMLFIIGLSIAISFNVDVINIAGKLSTDKDARDKLVAMAIKEANSQDSLKTKAVKDTLQKRITDANNLLAVGWGDYGLKRDSAEVSGNYDKELIELQKKIRDAAAKDPKKKEELVKKPNSLYHQALTELYNEHWLSLKVCYVIESMNGKKILGFLLLGFAVYLGAPFWFDLLQKLVKLRSSGKKEGTSSEGTQPVAAPQPVQVTLNNNSTTEAVG